MSLKKARAQIRGLKIPQLNIPEYPSNSEKVADLLRFRKFPASCCAQGRNRTTDTRIFSPLLYRLSYLGFSKFFQQLRPAFPLSTRRP